MAAGGLNHAVLKVRPIGELADSLILNFSYAFDAMLGRIRLDPEHNARAGRADVIKAIAYTFLLVPMGRGALVVLLSPWFAAAFMRLDDRVLPSRLYPAVLAWGFLLAWFPWWIQIPIVVLFALRSWQYAHFYRSDFAYEQRATLENPDRSRGRRLHNYAFVLVRENKMIQAEAEVRRVLRKDPTDARARMFQQMFEGGRELLRRGFFNLGFTCPLCGYSVGSTWRAGMTITKLEHDTIIFRICPKCGTNWGPNGATQERPL